MNARAMLLVLLSCGYVRGAETPPNFLIILCDNLGYGDVGCYGSLRNRTPHVDRLAREGTRFTHAYAVSGVCTPSRAGLLTGCYPLRVSLHQNPRGGSVLQPVEAIGLHPEEETLAEVLKKKNYATAFVGKWHLGDQREFLPPRQGFDFFYGIPYSDDMTPRPGKDWPPLPLLEGESVIEAPVDLTRVTAQYTQVVIDWMTKQKDRPFLMILSHALPGSRKVPEVGERFRGRSANGPWGDAVEEIDWSTGEILAALKRLGLDEKTLVIWTSDNGAPRQEPQRASNEPLGGWGYTTSEGGMRVPFIARWPGRVPAERTCDELITLMDLLPTFAAITGAPLPTRPIDGKEIQPLLFGQSGARSPHLALYYYHRHQLEAVRAGPWKLCFAQPARGKQPPRPQRLYDVVADPAETTDRLAEQPEVVKKLEALAERMREELGDGPRVGKAVRPPRRVDKPVPLVKK